MNYLPVYRMRQRLLTFFLLGIFMINFNPDANGQSAKDPGDYMAYIGQKYNDLSIQFYQYMSAIAHSNNARKIEKRRSELLTLSWDTYTDIRTMPIFRGNRALRDSAAAYLKINHRVLKEDFDKILNMELIAEQSYDDMEAYITAQREARNKLDVANIKMLVEQKKFAARYNLVLVERTDELFQRMQEANEALNYLNKVHLTFFKAHKFEIYLLEAMTEKNKDKITEFRSRLTSSAKEGMAYLEELGSYNGDVGLNHACHDLLRFYYSEAAEDVQDMIDYIHAEDEFEMMKTWYDDLPSEERTAENVGVYNAAVRKMNEASDAYNDANQHLNKDRLTMLEAWRLAYDEFLERHIPKF